MNMSTGAGARLRAGPVRLATLLSAIVAVAWGPCALAREEGGLPRHALLGAGAVDAPAGARISLIVPGGPASRSGLRVGDVVTSVGGQKIASAAEFIQRVKSQPAGTSIPFAIERGGASIMLPILLTAAPDEKDSGVATLYEAVAVDGSLRRTLITIPARGAGRRPALLVVGGIGCFSVDAAADHQDSYQRLAHDLSRAGFVVMRLEKSGVGDSRGPACQTVDLQTEMHSYEIALDALRHDPRVDPARVYIFGHSIGSLIAPRIALKQPVAGLVVAEGVGRGWFEYELANLRRQLDLDRIDPAKVDETMRLKELCMHRLLVNREGEAEIEKGEPGCKEINAYPAPASYLQQAAAFNISEPWIKLSLPLLIVYGTADYVTAEDDHQRIVDIVNAGHPGTATLKLIDGMDHLLHVGGTQQEDFDRAKKGGSGPYDERFSATVRAWLCTRERCLDG